MSTELDRQPYSLPAGADLSAKQFYCIKINTSGQAILCAAGTDFVDGILSNAPVSGDQARFNDMGIRKIIAGGTVTVGAKASVDAAGKAVISVTSGHLCFGKFLDAGVTGDLVRVLMQRGLANVP